MKNFQFLLLLMTCLPAALLLSSSAFGFTSGFINPKAYVGHEEITRQALQKVLARLNQERISEFADNSSGLLNDLAAAPGAPSGNTTTNPVIQGNYAADFPKGQYPVVLGHFFGITGFQWDIAANGQSLHFLRNHVNELTIDSAKATCLDSREKIKKASASASEAWNAGRRSEALFLLGTATHIIQDSFSKAHTVRASRENNNNLVDVCYYGTHIYEVMTSEAERETCYHGFLDHDDKIWISSADEQQAARQNWPDENSANCRNLVPGTEEEKQACLKDEARLAREATAKYLHLVFRSLHNGTAASLPASLDHMLFDGNAAGNDMNASVMPRGIARCEGLSEKRYVGRRKTDNNP